MYKHWGGCVNTENGCTNMGLMYKHGEWLYIHNMYELHGILNKTWYLVQMYSWNTCSTLYI